jgi:hypothetical protein
MRKKREERRRLRKLKTRTLFMLSLTLIFNAYAWFLYVSTVSTNMTVHVDSWSINFEADNQKIERELLFEIDNAYPGMEEKSKSVKITNYGDQIVDVEYKVCKVRILDDIYIVYDELSDEEKLELTGKEIQTTSDELLRMLEEDFPFIVTVSSTSEQLNTTEVATVDVKFNWSYEGNDEIDTEYGINSYKYYEENENQSAIQIKIKISAQQHKDEG